MAPRGNIIGRKIISALHNRRARYRDLDAIAWFSGNGDPQRVGGGAVQRSDLQNYENNLISKGNQTAEVGKRSHGDFMTCWATYGSGRRIGLTKAIRILESV